MIGVLVIDSIIPNDFKDFDLKFHETIANSLAIAIHNQKIYAEHARYQEERFSLDRSLALQAFMISFFHDITAPVQEIRSRINILGMQRESKWKDNLALLEELSEKLLFSYNEFVKDFTRPFSEPVRTSIREIIENSLENVERTKGLGINKIEGNFENSEINIECYMVFVEMAFRSIINNAVKYSRGVEPEDRYLKINVNTNNGDNLVIVSFESSSEEEIPHGKLSEIFKPFARFSKIEQGQGLGLSLAAECINFHNGEIYAENVKGKSAVRFIISLPQTLRIKKEY
jgi:K+-sensing histidine kinase KdpD